MPRADVVEVYDLLKPKLGEEESRALLHFTDSRGGTSSTPTTCTGSSCWRWKVT